MTRALDRHGAILAALFWGPMALAALWIVVWPPHSVDGPAHLLGARSRQGTSGGARNVLA